eukprot:CAMPEP_0113626402 /NCGR_PEP_ID=MMETSP0017_2-20120614/13653_1 /TAXON_ID=2856 /ORGANISM="Cylindrotheca closterium" /LENGTH=380 /DNA_ID=CAMNT_0000536579 /DNA_START=68 /DNA_END=1210 /DNA_ORIENTATION=+ /assembly_acc=CAM_ASM_000147
MMLVQHCVHSFHLRSIRPTTVSSRMLLDRSSKTALWRLFSAVSDGVEKKRVVFLGTPEVAATSLKKLYEVSQEDGSPFEIVSVITQPPKRRRRKGKLEPSPVGKVAEELELEVICPEKAKDADFLDNLEMNIKPDLCITAAYGQYLPKRFLAAPTYGTVNIHPSLLPRWRGASPVQRSLEAGDNPVGVTVLFTVSKMDAGPVISQKEETVDDNDTATNVLPHLFDIGTELLVDAMPDLLSGKITMDSATTQDEDSVVQAAMIDSGEAECKPWEESATTMHNKLRGFSMWPGAFVYLEVGEGMEATKFKLLETQVLDETADPTDAVVPGPSKKDGLRLVCADGSVLEINRLQPATRKPMDALSFVNGLNGKTVRWVKTPSE